MSNFSVLFKYSLAAKVKTKSFYITAGIFTFLGIFGLTIIITLVNLFGSETTVGIYGPNSKDLVEQLNSNDSYSADFEFSTSENSENQGEDEFDYIINLEDNSIFVYSDSQTDIVVLESIVVAIKQQEFLLDNNLDEEFITQYQESSQVELFYDESVENAFGIYYAIGIFYTLIVFTFLMFTSQLIGAEIVEEKSNRAMEVIMTSTTAMHHLLSKILSSVTFMIILAADIIISGIIGTILAAAIYLKDFKHMIPDASTIENQINVSTGTSSPLWFYIITVIILIITAIIIMSIVYATLAASVTSVEDFQKISMPVQFVLMIPYIISFINPPEIVQQIVASVPVMSTFALPTLILKSAIPTYWAVGIIILNIITTFIVAKICSKIYRYGVLNYSQAPFKKIVKDALKAK